MPTHANVSVVSRVFWGYASQENLDLDVLRLLLAQSGTLYHNRLQGF